MSRAAPSRRGRFALLLASLGAGVAIGAAGRALTGHDAWFLAVPLVVALAWWFVADPTRCRRGGGGGAG